MGLDQGGGHCAETIRIGADGGVGGEDVCGDAPASVERQAVSRALAALPEAQRRAIVLVDIGGLSAREAAEIEGSPRGTILARLHRGRRQLAVLAEREGLHRGP